MGKVVSLPYGKVYDRVYDPSLTGARFTINSLFTGGEAGAWYDPSDLGTLFQDFEGTTPVVADSNPVGLMLDKRLWAGKSLAEVVAAQPDLSTAFTAPGTGWSVVNADGTHIVTFGNGSMRYQSDTITPVLAVNRSVANLVVGNSYEVTTVCSAYTSGSVKSDALGGVVLASALGTKTVRVKATSTTFGILRNTANVDLTLASITIKEIPGNHADQPTAAARPLYKTSGGFRFIEADGVDDFLRASFTAAQPWDRISAFRQLSWAINERLIGGVTSDTRGVLYQSTVTPQVGMINGAAIANIGAPALNADFVATERHNDVSSRGAINNGAYSTGGVGSTNPGGITLFANFDNTLFSNARYYGGVMRSGLMSDAQIAQTRSAIGAKAGVVL